MLMSDGWTDTQILSIRKTDFESQSIKKLLWCQNFTKDIP